MKQSWTSEVSALAFSSRSRDQSELLPLAELPETRDAGDEEVSIRA